MPRTSECKLSFHPPVPGSSYTLAYGCLCMNPNHPSTPTPPHSPVVAPKSVSRFHLVSHSLLFWLTRTNTIETSKSPSRPLTTADETLAKLSPRFSHYLTSHGLAFVIIIIIIVVIIIVIVVVVVILLLLLFCQSKEEPDQNWMRRCSREHGYRFSRHVERPGRWKTGASRPRREWTTLVPVVDARALTSERHDPRDPVTYRLAGCRGIH